MLFCFNRVSFLALHTSAVHAAGVSSVQAVPSNNVRASPTRLVTAIGTVSRKEQRSLAAEPMFLLRVELVER